MGHVCCKPEAISHRPSNTANRNNATEKREITRFTENTQADQLKITQFKNKTQDITKYKTKLSGDDRLRIIQNAIEDLELTTEPIKSYYKMGEVLGAGKFGVVKIAYSIGK